MISFVSLGTLYRIGQSRSVGPVRGEQSMKATTRVVVIGGGIGGCSALYYLTREGWTDVVLVERDELTSGSTWHSAAVQPD